MTRDLNRIALVAMLISCETLGLLLTVSNFLLTFSSFHLKFNTQFVQFCSAFIHYCKSSFGCYVPIMNSEDVKLCNLSLFGCHRQLFINPNNRPNFRVLVAKSPNTFSHFLVKLPYRRCSHLRKFCPLNSPFIVLFFTKLHQEIFDSLFIVYSALCSLQRRI